MLICHNKRQNPSVCLINSVRTWRSPAAQTGVRSAGALSSGLGCRTSSCPGSESGWPRHACSLAQLGPKNKQQNTLTVIHVHTSDDGLIC